MTKNAPERARGRSAILSREAIRKRARQELERSIGRPLADDELAHARTVLSFDEVRAGAAATRLLEAAEVLLGAPQSSDAGAWALAALAPFMAEHAEAIKGVAAGRSLPVGGAPLAARTILVEEFDRPATPAAGSREFRSRRPGFLGTGRRATVTELAMFSIAVGAAPISSDTWSDALRIERKAIGAARSRCAGERQGFRAGERQGFRDAVHAYLRERDATLRIDRVQIEAVREQLTSDLAIVDSARMVEIDEQIAEIDDALTGHQGRTFGVLDGGLSWLPDWLLRRLGLEVHTTG